MAPQRTELPLKPTCADRRDQFSAETRTLREKELSKCIANKLLTQRFFSRRPVACATASYAAGTLNNAGMGCINTGAACKTQGLVPPLCSKRTAQLMRCDQLPVRS